ncbi:hypothetical protein OGAPHI_006214 [Ogataea philodendri]|uniref:Uncharacterized protein n=1 Tax=Ogataea philodendri TaxID=1378263 RepID=A0A9P8NXE0_9ASCO|nr:uncharacterized protein OGAPHI_006214 [Ogataea philodendri]KAH3662033.1 hypothetical protein OGAPHI_006214 [Ogataea philodendri]
MLSKVPKNTAGRYWIGLTMHSCPMVWASAFLIAQRVCQTVSKADSLRLDCSYFWYAGTLKTEFDSISCASMSPLLQLVLDDFNFSCISNHNWLGRAVLVSGFGRLDQSDNVHSFQDFAEDHVFSVKPWSFDGGDEELRSVGVSTGIGHRQVTWAFVFELEVLVLKLGTVNRFATSSISSCEISALDHEILNDSVEFGTFVAEFRIVRNA